MRNLFRSHNTVITRLLTVFLAALALTLCLAGAALADEITNPKGSTAVTAIRLDGNKAVLYNPQTGAAYTGLKKVREVPAGSGNFYYFKKKKNGVVYNNGFFKVGKKTYYARREGRLLTGVQKIAGNGYFFGRKGVLKKGGFIKVSSDVRY